LRFLEKASVAGYGRNRLEGVYIGLEFKNGRVAVYVVVMLEERSIV